MATDNSAFRVNLDGDNSGGRAVASKQQSVFVNKELVMTKDSDIGPHPGFFSSKVTSGSGTVFAEKRPIARKKDSLDCEHSIQTASPDVIIGD